MKEISFLIGSGFSVPADISSTKEINKTVSNTKKDQFYYSTDQSAGFLFGKAYVNNRHEHIEERKFVEEFLSFYNREIIGNKNIFNYEKFYDFFLEVYENKNINSKLETFLREFNEKNGKGYSRPLDSYLREFNIVFPQLIKSMVWKDFGKTRLAPGPSGVYPPNFDYGNFLNFIINLPENYLLHVHSMNHDLLMESFNDAEPFNGKLDDGFTTNGSQVYGELDIPDSNLSKHTYYVRLPVFADKYESRFRLYKLHGSIDRYRLYSGDEKRIIKVLRWVTPSSVCLEQNKQNGPEYEGSENSHIKRVPDFLTGTEYRITKYQDSFYSRMFEHFSENLKNSKTLIIIGYGFGDNVVNDRIDEFVQDKNNNVITIDVQHPEIPFNIMCPHEFLTGGVTNFNLNKLLSLINK